MHARDMAISATCVRVPVFIGHSEAINIEFSQPMSPDEARRILTQAPGVKLLDGQDTAPHVYPHQIAFNALPEIDVFLDNAYTKEEWKMVEETRKIMHARDMAISATCVRVPVFIGHSEAITIEFSQAMSPDEARRILVQAPSVKLLDDPAISLYPQPWSAAGTDEVFVGRIRRDTSCPNGLVMWVVADNLRKGAALNTVQIAEEMIKRGWLHPGG